MVHFKEGGQRMVTPWLCHGRKRIVRGSTLESVQGHSPCPDPLGNVSLKE